MKTQSVHEPNAPVMEAGEVWNDTRQVAQVLRQNLLNAEPIVQLQIPLSAFLSALDTLDREELIILRRRVEERMTN